MSDARPWWRSLGPGIISGASENDPTTVASLAVVGAGTGFVLGWLIVLVAPMLAVVQAVAAHVATVRDCSLQTMVKQDYPAIVAWILFLPLILVNVLTLAADVEGGAAALALLTHLDQRWFALPFAALAAFLLVRGSYRNVRKFLSFIPLVFFAYAIAAIAAHPDWHAVLRGSLIPWMPFDRVHIAGALALLGTTLTAYGYVWETIEISAERPSIRRIPSVQLDAVIGTVVAIASFWCILTATAATLGVHHQHVQTAQDAAAALEPIAGRFAGIIFGVGLLGSAILAVPVIAATSGFVIGAMFDWKRALNDPFPKAPQFYSVIIGALAVAGAVGSFGFNPIRLLYFSSIAGGLATPVSLAMLMYIAGSRRSMKGKPVAPWLRLLGWLVTAVVTVAAIAFLIAG
jgi:Mn2+/Fe2+ NRAMP family transporter